MPKNFGRMLKRQWAGFFLSQAVAAKNQAEVAVRLSCFSVGVTFGYGDMTLLSQDKATKPDLLIRALPEIYENLQPQKKQRRRIIRLYFQTAFSVLSPNQAV